MGSDNIADEVEGEFDGGKDQEDRKDMEAVALGQLIRSLDTVNDTRILQHDGRIGVVGHHHHHNYHGQKDGIKENDGRLGPSTDPDQEEEHQDGGDTDSAGDSEGVANEWEELAQAVLERSVDRWHLAHVHLGNRSDDGTIGQRHDDKVREVINQGGQDSVGIRVPIASAVIDKGSHEEDHQDGSSKVQKIRQNGDAEKDGILARKDETNAADGFLEAKLLKKVHGS